MAELMTPFGEALFVLVGGVALALVWLWVLKKIKEPWWE